MSSEVRVYLMSSHTKVKLFEGFHLLVLCDQGLFLAIVQVLFSFFLPYAATLIFPILLSSAHRDEGTIEKLDFRT